MAFGAGNYFVTWTHYTGTFGGDPTHIYGTRVDTALNVLDPSGIPISTATALSDYSAVTFDNTNYVAVWTSGPNSNQRDVFATRINTSGGVTNPNGVLVSGSGDPYVAVPAIGSGGGTNFVAWQDGTPSGATGKHILGARLGVNGALPDPKGLLVSTGPAAQRQPDVAFDGTNYLVVWSEGAAGFEDIRGTRVTPAGVVLDPGGIADRGHARPPVLGPRRVRRDELLGSVDRLAILSTRHPRQSRRPRRVPCLTARAST